MSRIERCLCGECAECTAFIGRVCESCNGAPAAPESVCCAECDAAADRAWEGIRACLEDEGDDACRCEACGEVLDEDEIRDAVCDACGAEGAAVHGGVAS